jgi:hypothetical protein
MIYRMRIEALAAATHLWDTTDERWAVQQCGTSWFIRSEVRGRLIEGEYEFSIYQEALDFLSSNAPSTYVTDIRGPLKWVIEVDYWLEKIDNEYECNYDLSFDTSATGLQPPEWDTPTDLETYIDDHDNY